MKEFFRTEALKSRYYLLAFFWVLMLVFFTYTPIVMSAVTKNISFPEFYFDNQSHFVAFLVNIGLVLMLFFDFHVTRKSVHNYFVWIMLIGVLSSAIIYGHSRLADANFLDNYHFPFGWRGFSFVFHLLFLFILVFLKERTLETELNVAKKFENNKIKQELCQ